MKTLLLIFFELYLIHCEAQLKETSMVKRDTLKSSIPTNQNSKPEIFTSGFIDVQNNGQVNASARFIRLLIGEPGKFQLPLSIYSGVSSNPFQPGLSGLSNTILVSQFINPLTGLANLSIDGALFFDPDKPKITRQALLYHIGQRILTGIKTGLVTDPLTGRPINVPNSFASIGFYFQTGAWDRLNTKKIGVTWLALRFIGSYTSPSQLKKLIQSIQTNGIYHGYSIAWGVEISNYVNSRLVYYNYLKRPEIDFNLPIYQFSFNYSLRK